MVQVSYPGVYVQEVSSGVRTITGVSTSIAAFVGVVQRGPLGVPVTVLSFADYQRAFGDDVTDSEMTDQVRQFFVNGGQQAVVTRIADPSITSASSALKTELGTASLTLTAKDAGGAGNQIRAVVSYDTPDPESTFNLRIFREAVKNGVVQIDGDETWSGVSMDPADPNYVVTVLSQRSTLATATVTAPAATFQGYSLSGLLIDATTPDTAVTALNARIATPNNKITIRVDGKPAVVAPLSPMPLAGNLDTSLLTWATDINNALGGVATVTVTSVAGPGTSKQIKIQSAAAGGSVLVSPAPGGDAADSLQLGSAQGGIEISGNAGRRPAPSGLFSRLGTTLGGLGDLNTFAALTNATLTGFTLTDASGNAAPPFGPPLGFPAGKFYEPVVSGPTLVGSLRNVQKNLQILANQLTAHTNGNWVAVVAGFRIVLTPTFGNVDSDVTAHLTTAGTNLGTSLFAANTNVRAYSLGRPTAPGYQTSSAAATDGAQSPDATAYGAAFVTIDRQVDLFNILVLPKSTRPGFTDTRSAVWGPASNFCLARRAFLIADAPSTDTGAWTDVATAVAGIDAFRTGIVKDHTALYWPPVTVAGTNGKTRSIDPSGSAAGIMARTDANRGVFKAPAGIEADVRGVRGVTVRMSDPENGRLNPKAVNAVRVFPNGVVVWGARTLDGFDNSGNDDYKYVPVRRLALFIEESLVRGLKFAVFEPNDEPLWAQIRLAAGAFMNNLFRQGAFQGRKQSDAYFVKVDSETTTQNDINLGIVNVVVGFAPLKPAEFVVITIQQKAGQVQV